MSVLKQHRSQSKAEYINAAHEISVRTVEFLSRLSARYSRLLATPVSNLASAVIDNAEAANNIYPSDDIRKGLREKHLLEARAALAALDVKLSDCYDILMRNPEGCFTTASGRNVGATEAEKKLNHMAQELGELIDKENTLLTNVLKSDKGR